MKNISNIDALISDKLLRIQLINIRKSKKLTQKDISRLSGLSESCISNIESSEQVSPTLRSLIKYAEALDVEIFIKIREENNDKDISS